MNQIPATTRKRNFSSHQNTQTSIINYSKQKKQQKSMTPEHSALTRSYSAITKATLTINPPPGQLKLSNNL
jgi:hypothetical protein